jgi:hypothetical protein
MIMKHPFKDLWTRFRILQLSAKFTAVSLIWIISSTSVCGANSKVPGEALFADGRITRLELEISTNDMAQLRDQKLTGLRERPAYAVTVREGKRTYKNVQMHLKGSWGSFRSMDSKPAMTLNFSAEDDDQRFHGLKKISLNNSVQDSTYLSEKFSRELFRKIGVPCPRVGYATVKVNGQHMGLYLLVESYGKQFLKQHFSDTSGNLYDIPTGEELDLTGKQPVNSGDQPGEQGELRTLVEALNVSDHSDRMRQLARALDLDRFMKQLALDVLICNWDGYGWGQNNYRIFNDRAQRRLVFMPHGLDQTFQAPESSITPRMAGAVAKAILETREGLQLYLRELGGVLEQISPAAGMTNRVQKLAQVIRPELARRSEKDTATFDEEVAKFCEHIVQRMQVVRAQLEEASKPVKFSEQGELPLNGFVSSNDFGEANFAGEAGHEHHLRVSSTNRPAIGWWKRKVWLPQGRYRFEGKVRGTSIETVFGDSFGGAGLRVGGHRLTKGLKGTTDWTNLSVDFEITDPLFPIELICELRCATGEAFFDEGSLRVTRR